MKIFIGMPTYDKTVDVEIMSMAMQLPGLYPEHQFAFDFVATSWISDSRNYLVKRFMETGYDYLYFWDNDVVIRDTDFLSKLLETVGSLKADIVGGAYRIKSDKKLYAIADCADRTFTNYKVGELTEPKLVDCIATGSMLIARKVFETMEEPWFTYKEEKGIAIPEDFHFCIKAKELGFKTAVDPRFATYHYGYAFWEHLPKN